MKPLADRIALVTGASRGIGRAIAVRLAQDGALVGVHYRAERDKAKETLDLIRLRGGDGFLITADLAEPAGVSQLAAALLGELRTRRDPPKLDILVNNAGIDDRKSIEQVTEADFDRMLQINFKSPFFLIQKLLPVVADGGRILTCGATAGYDPPEDLRVIWTFELQIRGSNGWARDDLEKLFALVSTGKLTALIDKSFPLEQAAEALRMLEDRKVFGKVVVTP